MIDLGLIIAIAASLIALWGVYQFNQQDNSGAARKTWFWSNSLFVAYFLGRVLGLWDGLLGDLAMLAYFGAMWISNVMGMWKK